MGNSNICSHEPHRPGIDDGIVRASAVAHWLSPPALLLQMLSSRIAQPRKARGATLVEFLRRGGLILFFRHPDTAGMPYDRTYQMRDRPSQRDLSPE
jgi:hypothetical protein